MAITIDAILAMVNDLQQTFLILALASK